MSLKCILTGKNEDLDAKLADKIGREEFQHEVQNTSKELERIDTAFRQHTGDDTNPHLTTFSKLKGAGKETVTLDRSIWWSPAHSGSSEYDWETEAQLILVMKIFLIAVFGLLRR